MKPDEIILETEDAMQKGVDYVLHEMSSIRTGKASPALVENMSVTVAAYGSNMPLKQLAMIATPEPRMITITPFDPTTMADIERALRESKLGINPASDGKMIRLPIPELSEERRRDLVKVIKDTAETGRVRVRGARRDGIDQVKASQKAGDLTEDSMHDLEKQIQDLTNKYVKMIDEHLEHKDKEIMTV